LLCDCDGSDGLYLGSRIIPSLVTFSALSVSDLGRDILVAIVEVYYWVVAFEIRDVMNHDNNAGMVREGESWCTQIVDIASWMRLGSEHEVDADPQLNRVGREGRVFRGTMSVRDLYVLVETLFTNGSVVDTLKAIIETLTPDERASIYAEAWNRLMGRVGSPPVRRENILILQEVRAGDVNVEQILRCEPISMPGVIGGPVRLSEVRQALAGSAGVLTSLLDRVLDEESIGKRIQFFDTEERLRVWRERTGELGGQAWPSHVCRPHLEKAGPLWVEAVVSNLCGLERGVGRMVSGAALVHFCE
jgi:hypothetical protein